MIKRIKYWFRSFSTIETVKEAEKMGLTFKSNVHGEAINKFNCRSFWHDEFGNEYKCSQLKNKTTSTK